MVEQQYYHKVRRFCEENHIFSTGDRVAIAISGGADSVFLALILMELEKVWALKLSLVHVNHGIRGVEADRDEQFCLEFAREHELPIKVYHGDVPSLAARKGISEEEAAREYRYECIHDLLDAQKIEKAAVAHHQNDQAETVLFQMLRGSSIRGLGGMKPVHGRIVRPLLLLCHEEMTTELERMGQPWCEDSTNVQMQYQRNKIRHQVMPILEEHVNSSASAHLSRLALQMQQVQSFLENELDQRMETLLIQDTLGGEMEGERSQIDIERFLKLPEVLQSECAYRILVEQAGKGKDITTRHIDSLIRLAGGESGKRLHLPYDLIAGKDQNRVWVVKKSAMMDFKAVILEDEPVCWEKKRSEPIDFFLHLTDGRKRKFCFHREHFSQKSGKIPKNNCTKWIDYARIDGAFEFRHPRPGDYLWLMSDKRGRKALNRLFIDLHVPREKREYIWVLAEGQHIVWIPELGRVSAKYYISEQTQEILCMEMSEESWLK